MNAVLSFFSLFLYFCLKDKNNFTRIFVFLEALFLIIISAIRNKAVGNDTYRYIMLLEYAQYDSWDFIFNNLGKAYFNPDNSLKDPGYMIFEKLISCFTIEQIPFLFIVAFITIVSFVYFVKSLANSKIQILLSFILFIVFVYSNFPNQTIRQSLSFAIICISYVKLRNQEDIKFILLVLIASFFHKSALILLLFYFIYKYVYSKIILFATPFLFCLILMMPSFILPFISHLGDVYSNYFTNNYYMGSNKPINILLFLGLMYFFIFVSFYLKKSDIDTYKMELTSVSFCVITSALILINPSLFRLSLYFFIWFGLLLPELINCWNNKKMFYRVLFLILAFRIFTSQDNYSFYWEHKELHDSYYSYNNNLNININDKLFIS